MTGPAKTAAWTAVRLTEARQVASLSGIDRDEWPPADLDVRQGYEQLRGATARSAALDYLGHALPRLEAINWAARIIADAAVADPPAPRARHALDVALRWLEEPSEAHRRAAGTAADEIARPVPERLLAAAVFYSGGSIADPGAPPVMPPDHVAARYAIAAIGAAASRSADPTAALDAALALGERIAERGLAALDP